MCTKKFKILILSLIAISFVHPKILHQFSSWKSKHWAHQNWNKKYINLRLVWKGKAKHVGHFRMIERKLRHRRMLLAYTLPVSIVIFKYQSGNWCPSSLILRFIWYLGNHKKCEILACFKVAWIIDHYKDLCTIVAQITALDYATQTRICSDHNVWASCYYG